jgi:hypothetical protein
VRSVFGHPAIPILLLLGAMIAALLLLLRLPVGPNLWDLFFHLDAAYRIDQGQVPHKDFFSPAGPLPFYLLAGFEKLFSRGAPLLLAQYAVAFPAALGLLVVVFRLKEDQRGLSWLLTLPFAVFALLPFNTSSFFPAPGIEAIGLYNRQAGLILTVFTAAAFLMREGILRALLLGLLLAALFFLKVNGFAAALLLLLFLAVSGRILAHEAAIAFALMLAMIVAAEAVLGIVTPYGDDLRAMANQNAGALPSRILTLLSVKFDVAAPLVLLVLFLFFVDRRAVADCFRSGLRGWRETLRLPSVELGAATALILLYESQNTGGQEFLPLWPVLLRILVGVLRAPPNALRAALLVLIAAATLPSLTHLVQAGARAAFAGAGYAAIDAPGTEALGYYSTKPEYLKRANVLLPHYAAARESYAALADEGEMPNTILYSTPDYQALHILDLSSVIAALKTHEAARGKPYESVATLDATDPLPFLLGRRPVKWITISFDPARGYPASEYPAFAEALLKADAILAPHCPETPARQIILAAAAKALDGREKIRLSDCWDLYARR